jgi:hypothetical protein
VTSLGEETYKRCWLVVAPFQNIDEH